MDPYQRPLKLKSPKPTREPPARSDGGALQGQRSMAGPATDLTPPAPEVWSPPGLAQPRRGPDPSATIMRVSVDSINIGESLKILFARPRGEDWATDEGLGSDSVGNPCSRQQSGAVMYILVFAAIRRVATRNRDLGETSLGVDTCHQGCCFTVTFVQESASFVG
ncbi:hypothetical protein GE21DRAFT_5793 [Neurospora crassa]|nr:hypothetical protein GE21DRAFT_5793 [Neurospora crassa]